MFCAAIYVHGGRAVISLEIPHAFIQIPMDLKNDEDKLIMKVRGELFDLMIDIYP